MLGRYALDAKRFRPPQARLQGGDDAVRHLFLDGEQLHKRPVEVLGPQVPAGFPFCQPDRHAHRVALLAHASFHDIARRKLALGPVEVGRLAGAIGIGGAAADHGKALRAGKRHDDLVGQAGRQVVERRLFAEIAERPDRDSRPLDLLRRGTGRCGDIRQRPHRRHEAVAAAVLGDDEMRPARIVAEFLAQPAHQRVDGAVVDVLVGLAQGVEQEVAAERAPGGPQEHREQAHFLARQVDDAAVGRGQAAVRGRETPAREGPPRLLGHRALCRLHRPVHAPAPPAWISGHNSDKTSRQECAMIGGKFFRKAHAGLDSATLHEGGRRSTWRSLHGCLANCCPTMRAFRRSSASSRP